MYTIEVIYSGNQSIDKAFDKAYTQTRGYFTQGGIYVKGLELFSAAGLRPAYQRRGTSWHGGDARYDLRKIDRKTKRRLRKMFS